MLLLAALVIGLVAGITSGGKLGNAANLAFRWPWLVIAALIVKEATALSSLSRIEGIQYLYAATLALLVAWTVWHIERVRGVWIVAAGAALNLIVVLANGARMPVAPALAGDLVERGHSGQYVVMGPATNLSWLADWIAVPAQLGGAYSPGDVVVALGIATVAFFATRRLPEPKPAVGETPTRIVIDPP
ncbi:MAG: hypothetical protein E6J18_11130 [Chloroflexi bacterium]|nr:MAG: hypothetical protein E6J37_03870 [Chloroflexota bacterium]TMC70104.1 MAG: hypothetical protein E6J18_11130 [Chloroflexota bacterium]